MLLSRPQAIYRITAIDKIHNLNRDVYISPPTCALRPIILNNARPSRITAAAGTRLAGTSKICTVIIYTYSTEFTTYVAVILKAISLDQACAHCPIFPTAAARKRLGRVSVPVWPIILSNRLGILGLVRHYHTNYLIPRKLIHGRYISKPHRDSATSRHKPWVDSHVLRTRSLLIQNVCVQLACVRCIASVNSEPGSNSCHIVASIYHTRYIDRIYTHVYTHRSTYVDVLYTIYCQPWSTL